MPAAKPAAQKAVENSPEEIKRRLEATNDPLEKLRIPFASNQIGLLPRQRKKDDTTAPSGCRPGTSASVDGLYCGGYHKPSIHLDFVGHAAITDRLLDVDPNWYWEPMAINADTGLPQFDQFGGLWIRLFVAGHSRLGYGDSQGKQNGPTAVKEVIGDALRNAGMRFGMALELWHKGDLHDSHVEQGRGEDGAPERMGPARDYVADAGAAPDTETAVQIWREAKAAFGGRPTKDQAEVLEQLVTICREMKDREEALKAQSAPEEPSKQIERPASQVEPGEIDPRDVAEANAAADMHRGFGSEATPA